MANCAYCFSASHQPLCPMAFIEANPNRKQAYDMGVPPATSDWIAAWCQQNDVQLTPEQAESLTESFSLHHLWVEQQTRERAA